jgi:hypothetical protein
MTVKDELHAGAFTVKKLVRLGLKTAAVLRLL